MQYYRMFMADTQGIVCDDADLCGFSRDRLFKGCQIDEWNEQITLWYEKGEAEDYLANALHWEVVSSKMRVALERAAPGQAQYLPVQVRHRGTGAPLEGYFVVNPLHRIEAFDWQRAKYDISDYDSIKYVNIYCYALRQQAAAPFDIFRLAEEDITVIISERVRVALGAAKVTGCVYRKVPTV